MSICFWMDLKKKRKLFTDLLFHSFDKDKTDKGQNELKKHQPDEPIAEPLRLGPANLAAAQASSKLSQLIQCLLYI